MTPAAPDVTRLDFDRVEVADVSRHFGRRRALARVTADFTAGQITALLGPNGAGKTTLLGVLSTMVRPSGGEVRYGGQRAGALGDALRGQIGVLGHDLYLYADLTAHENLMFFGRLYGIADLERQVAEALVAAGLGDRAHDRVSGYSRGMRQRLALERALLHRPRLVLLDEPFTGLDDAATSGFVDRLHGLRTSGAIVVMATHDFETADAVIDRAVCLREGRLLPIEGSGSLRSRYRQTTQGTSA